MAALGSRKVATLLTPRKAVGFSLADFMATQGDGFWFDFGQTDRLFQENVGSTPADDPNEVIGLALDQRAWGGRSLAQVAAAGPELLVNGDGTNAAGWSANFANVSSVAGRFRVENTDAANTTAGRIFRTVPCVVGRTYRLVASGFQVTSTARIAVNAGSANFGDAQVDANTTNGTITKYFVATSTLMTIILGLSSATLGHVAEFDEVSVKEVSPRQALQATASFKPKFQATGAAFDGTDDNLLTGYLAAAGANFLITKVAVPATIPAFQYIAGLNGASAQTRFGLGINTDGTVGFAAGNTAPIVSRGTIDVRGQTVVVGLSLDAASVRGFVGTSQDYSGALVGAVDTATPVRLGSFNSNGTASTFFAGSIKAIVAGRQFLDLETFNKIAAAL